MATQNLVSRIIYRSAYVLCYIFLVGLLLITPGDAIQRSLQNGQNYNILILTICYVATIVIVAFVYALRLYINKTALSAIPKAWVPIDKSDVKDVVYRMITNGLNRSAAIAYLSRPRDLARSNESFRPIGGYLQPQRLGMKTVESVGHDVGIKLPSQHALWGDIEQNGWASPNSEDLPNLQYSTVLSELPNLVEAKALTLAPADPMSTSEAPMVDADAAELLQRQPNMSLRQYLEHLVDTGIMDMDATVTEFLDVYEYARYSTTLIPNATFRHMMNLFADVLRNMTGPDPDAFAQAIIEPPSESDIDSDAPLATNPTTPRSNYSRSIIEGAGSAPDSEDSHRPSPPRRNSSFNAWSLYATAPNTPGSRRTGMLSRKRSNNSLATDQSSVLRFPRNQRSNASLRSHATSSTGSVIRLAVGDERNNLPYVISTPPQLGE